MAIKNTYIAGDMLSFGSQLQRKWEKEQLEQRSIPLFNPADADHNNKQKEAHNNDDLAERIVRNDVNAILNSDTVIIEPLPQANGTMVELGQIHMFNWWHNELIKVYNHSDSMGDFGSRVLELITKYPYKTVFPHYQDVRRHNQPEVGDRRSMGVNAYVYGVCLDLTDGKGFYEYDEMFEKLQELNEDNN